MHVNRCNVNLEDECKLWYVTKAKSMGVSMSNLLSFVCTNYYEQQRNAETLRNISEMNQNEELKELNENVKEMMKMFAELAQSDDEK